jgi:hypothetical protein
VSKSLKKLNLCRETLRALGTSDLGRIEGGAVLTKLTCDPTCQTNCDCTYSCPPVCPISERTHCM